MFSRHIDVWGQSAQGQIAPSKHRHLQKLHFTDTNRLTVRLSQCPKREGPTVLRIDKLTKRFGDKIAVDTATLEIDRPCMIGVIGRSGAGKSTLLRMINRLSDASEGRILFEGREITGLRGGDKRAWQSECAMIFQQFNLVPRMDVVSNVLHGTLNRRSTFATMFNLFPMDDIHKAIDILDRLGIAEHAAKRAEALSGGQQQRVAIARALMQDPKILSLIHI